MGGKEHGISVFYEGFETKLQYNQPMSQLTSVIQSH